MGMVQVSLTLLLYTFRNFCAKFTKPLNLTSVGANFDQKKILCSNKSVKLTLWTFEPCRDFSRALARKACNYCFSHKVVSRVKDVNYTP